MIENTQDPKSMELTALLAFATGDPSAIIENQERAGQAQLVNSEQLPSKMNDPRADFEALGFTFGDSDPRDPLFVPATLPGGWQREGSGHAMWSYITDRLGRRRVRIFCKAAFYDREAFMSLATVYGYVGECVYEKKEIVTDGTWATREAVAEAAGRYRDHAAEQIEFWTRHGDEKYVTEHTAERDAYAALAAKYED